MFQVTANENCGDNDGNIMDYFEHSVDDDRHDDGDDFVSGIFFKSALTIPTLNSPHHQHQMPSLNTTLVTLFYNRHTGHRNTSTRYLA